MTVSPESERGFNRADASGTGAGFSGITTLPSEFPQPMKTHVEIAIAIARPMEKPRCMVRLQRISIEKLFPFHRRHILKHHEIDVLT